MLQNILFLVVAVISSSNAELPLHVNKCSKSDPKLSECMIKSANIFTENILKPGYPEYNIPSFQPYPLGDLDISGKNSDLQFVLKNGKSYSDGVTVNGANFDFEAKLFVLNFHVGSMIWYVDFDIKGPLNKKEIHEVGKANITVEGLQFNYTAKWDYEEIKGAKHFKVISSEASTTSDSFTLVPYDQQSKGQPLDDELKAKLQETLSGVKYLVREKVKEIGGGLWDITMNEVFKRATADEMFLP